MTDASAATKRSHEYELGHSDWELNRLVTQARLVDPITRQYFVRAGLAAGMRVLDIGSGAGDVAFLAAELVGPTGEVVGTDRSATAIVAAGARAKQRSLPNVTFLEGDPSSMTFDRPFDAIVGRYVLMFNPRPAEVLMGITRHLRSGGRIVFHEPDWTGVRSEPRSPLFDQCCNWIVQTFRKVGSDPNMGLHLHSAFLAAGLPAPDMGLQALAGGGQSDRSGIDMIADLTVTMAPVIEQHGVATMIELAPETLKQRMLAEATANGSVVVGRYEVGAWAKVG